MRASSLRRGPQRCGPERHGPEQHGSGPPAGGGVRGRPWRVPLAVCGAGLPAAVLAAAYLRGHSAPGAPLVTSVLPDYIETLPWFAHGLWAGCLILLVSSVLVSLHERARIRWLMCAAAGAAVLATALAGAIT